MANDMITDRSPSRETHLRCLVFAVGKSQYAIDARDALHILKKDRLIEVPGARREIGGAMAYGQEIYGILDLSVVLATPAEKLDWVVLLRHENRYLGFLVSEFIRMEQVPTEKYATHFSATSSELLFEVPISGGTLPFVNTNKIFELF